MAAGVTNRGSGVAAGSGRASSSDLLVIHVRDDARKVNRDFTCSQSLLLRHMKYFEIYLKGVTNSDDVDISVHCDVSVFEWLVQYMENPQKVEELQPSSVVSILISSEFLQMSGLVDTCLDFMKGTLDQVLRLPLDLGCLSNELVRRLASRFEDEELDAVRDRRDRLLSRLYANKLEALLMDDNNLLNRCSSCQRMFLERHRDKIICPKAKVRIDFNGVANSKHSVDSNWDVSHYVQHCHDRLRLTWRETYWRLWGHTQLLWCSICQQFFSAAEMEHCSYHPERAVWQPAPCTHIGCYPCCTKSAQRLGTLSHGAATGCCAREHLLALDDAEGLSIVEKISKHRSFMCVPFAERDSKLKLPGVRKPGAELDDDEDEEGDNSGREAEEGEEEEWDCHNEATVYWGGPGHGHRMRGTWYCLDPPPEHVAAHFNGRGRPGIGRRMGGGRSGTPLRRSSKLWRSDRSKSGERDGDEQAVASTVRRPPWFTNEPEVAQSFFDDSYPPGVSSSKKWDYRMEILREDDRRRMDSLVDRISMIRENCAEDTSISTQNAKLSWIGVAAAAEAGQQVKAAATSGAGVSKERDAISNGTSSASTSVGAASSTSRSAPSSRRTVGATPSHIIEAASATPKVAARSGAELRSTSRGRSTLTTGSTAVADNVPAASDSGRPSSAASVGAVGRRSGVGRRPA